MMEITIFGKGNMGKAIGGNFEKAGNSVTYGGRDFKGSLGDVVVLAVPYSAVDSILAAHKDELAGKVLVDITNPVNFDTFDGLVVPADSSAAAEIQKKVPEALVVKAFNTTFAGVLAAGKVGDKEPAVVLAASDSEEAKKTLAEALEGSGLSVVDAGSLKRTREMEALGFLQISLAAREKISWTGGFAVIH
ncbi:NADPH-dependent F420 reductase [uncultured Dialister sp.]|uniref:NADPH-dependent F420 reductase n=1 Tax=uncultured Dialister sp. TaxID=278064 RepID=UPI0025FBF537|nr:NADPH-dependent F420 reductase [uncultured Dialister sp.]